MPHDFLENTLSHWLSSINEKGYQAAFCHCLMHAGHTVLYNSTHTSYEHGKDIVTRTKDGQIHAFQLKGGGIGKSRWRTEVRGEIEELRDVTIELPSLPRGTGHTSYLVTNGVVTDPVLHEINNRNNGVWSNAPLVLWQRDELLQYFVSAAKNALPNELQDYKLFIDLYFIDGKGFSDPGRFQELLLKCVGDHPRRAIDWTRDLAAMALIGSLIVERFSAQQNFAVQMQLLTILLATIMMIVERFELEDGDWVNHFIMISAQLESCGAQLESELLDEAAIDEQLDPYDLLMGSHRKSFAFSFLIAYKVAQVLMDAPGASSLLIGGNVQLLLEQRSVGADSLIIPEVLVFLYWDHYLQGRFETHHTLIENLLTVVKTLNEIPSAVGLAAPYYEIDELVRIRTGLEGEQLEEKWVNESHSLESLMEIAARRNLRDMLSTHWPWMSRFTMRSFRPAEPWMTFLHRAPLGTNVSCHYPAQLSWKEIVYQSECLFLDSVPRVFELGRSFLPYFLVVFPHRATPDMIRVLDKVMAEPNYSLFGQ